MKENTHKIKNAKRSKNLLAKPYNSKEINLFNNSDLELSCTIQKAMVPKHLPQIQNLDIKALFFPCSHVGGDLYDIIQLSDDKIAFYIFDVSVHGVSSVLIASLTKVIFTEVLFSLHSPQTVLERVNARLLEYLSTNFFITAFIGVLDLHSNKLTFCNAGHIYPILYKKKEKNIVPLKTPGMFMGVYKNVDFENDSTYLFPEDRLYIFTDGVYSLFDSENAILARNLFEEFIQKEHCRQPADVLEKLKLRYNEMIKIKKQRDDITTVIIDILTQSKRNQIKKDLGFTEDMPVYLQYLSYYEEIDKVSANILKDMDETGYSDENIRKMKLTITELLANAIGHGNMDDHSKKVILGHIVETSVAIIAVMDEGQGFNPSQIPDPTLPENLTKDHGRGLYIIRNYVDEIHFNKRGNRILIRKYRFTNKNDKL